MSTFIKLQKGDLIIAGTPDGVGAGIKPHPIFLKDGDIIKFGGIQVLQTENSNNLFRQVGGFILTEFFDEGDNAILEQSADGGKITLEHLA